MQHLEDSCNSVCWNATEHRCHCVCGGLNHGKYVELRLDNFSTLKNDVIIGSYKRPWNAKPESRVLAAGIPKSNLWAYDPNGINQIGCVYTAQGFEFDYAGVIFGNDLIYDFDKQSWVGNRENSADTVVRRSKDQFVDLVKRTYRVLLSRGMKGCYVYFMDKDTERFFKSRIESNNHP